MKIKGFFVLVILVSCASAAAAQSAGTFIPAGNMTAPRFFHTATLLADGRVLIAGGTMLRGTGSSLSLNTLSSAELYDPSTGRFTATGNLTMPRDGHTATLLPDGKVLIAGGGIAEGTSLAGVVLASSELYDPVTGRFSAAGDMTSPRIGHTATLMNNGKVLITGGGAASGPLSAELYDSSTGSFIATGDMTSAGADTATLLPSGQILIYRGGPEITPRFFAELFDPSTGTFAGTGNSTTNHTGPTATLLTNGKVLIAGGDWGDGDGGSYIAELYDPAIGAFAAAGNMTSGREQHTATLLRDGTVLLAGGHIIAASAELYDPVHETFTSTGDMTTRRELQTATLLNDGRVLIAGGDDERYWVSETILSSAELYVPSLLVAAQVVTAFQFDRTSVFAGGSYSVNVSGSNLTSQTFFDVRFISPGSNESAVVLNWQSELAASHDVPASTAAGSWTINGVRAHQIQTDHTGSFIPVSATITVSP